MCLSGFVVFMANLFANNCVTSRHKTFKLSFCQHDKFKATRNWYFGSFAAPQFLIATHLSDIQIIVFIIMTFCFENSGFKVASVKVHTQLRAAASRTDAA